MSDRYRFGRKQGSEGSSDEELAEIRAYLQRLESSVQVLHSEIDGLTEQTNRLYKAVFGGNGERPLVTTVARHSALLERVIDQASARGALAGGILAAVVSAILSFLLR